MPKPTSKSDAARMLSGMWRFSRAFTHSVEPRLKERHGLELRTYFLLKGIQHGPAYPKTLANKLEVPSSLMSRYLDGLQKDGLIDRRIDPQDSRRVILSLTDKGERTVREVDDLMNELASQRLARLDDETLSAFLRGLDILTSEEGHE
ncbi:MAG TPA: MarR family transcriptional regulator [Stenomitos sp.]